MKQLISLAAGIGLFGFFSHGSQSIAPRTAAGGISVKQCKLYLRDIEKILDTEEVVSPHNGPLPAVARQIVKVEYPRILRSWMKTRPGRRFFANTESELEPHEFSTLPLLLRGPVQALLPSARESFKEWESSVDDEAFAAEMGRRLRFDPSFGSNTVPNVVAEYSDLLSITQPDARVTFKKDGRYFLDLEKVLRTRRYATAAEIEDTDQVFVEVAVDPREFHLRYVMYGSGKIFYAVVPRSAENRTFGIRTDVLIGRRAALFSSGDVVADLEGRLVAIRTRDEDFMAQRRAKVLDTLEKGPDYGTRMRIFFWWEQLMLRDALFDLQVATIKEFQSYHCPQDWNDNAVHELFTSAVLPAADKP